VSQYFMFPQVYEASIRVVDRSAKPREYGYAILGFTFMKESKDLKGANYLAIGAGSDIDFLKVFHISFSIILRFKLWGNDRYSFFLLQLGGLMIGTNF